MARRPTRQGFTLIELLVVIAIIAIMSAMLMPSLSSVTDRSRVTECRANLSHLALALQAYHADTGQYPPRLECLLPGGYVTDPDMVRCTHTGATYFYAPPTGADMRQIVVACTAPATPVGQRPHGQRTSLVVLERGGRVREVGR
ncbi:prepilin-type N-terminal cleavage/methylation domain-containing protein [bacterium]|nr:prepilin-type N-terminal cleavage/methylation domain-containing protein [bacterium]